MDTGTKISAAGHALLLGWLLAGPVFQTDPPQMTVQDVSVISSEEFAALRAPRAAPEAATDVDQPDASISALDNPGRPEPEAAPAMSTRPPSAAAPEAEAVPEVPATPAAPPAEVAEDAPQVEAPPEDVAVLAPEAAPQPVPRQAERVAPEPVARPDPDAAPDPVEQSAVTPDTSGEIEREAQEATAPPETTTEIVTEADEPAAPESSPRPPARQREAPTPTVEAQIEPEEQPERQEEAPEAPAADDIAAAVASAVAGSQSEQAQPAQNAAPVGRPLSGSELEGLRVAVGSCWNVGTLSTEAQETTVTVYVAMNENGTPRTDSIRMISSSGGGESAARKVFDTARRAIIRCGSDGFPLPPENYGQWREIEMTFNPEGMFWR